MTLTKEEEDRLKFSGEGTEIKRTGPPTFMETVRAADAALGKGINYVGENLPKVPKKLWDATAINRSNVNGEVNPVEATGRFLSRLASNAPNTFGGAEMGASAGQLPITRSQVTTTNRPTVMQNTSSDNDVITLQPYGMKRTSSNNTVTPVRELAKSTISPGGFTVTPNENVYGGSIRSLGTPGTDGSGYGYTSGPARGAQSRESFLSEVARRNQMGRGQVGGLSFEGSGADFAKFAQMPTRPVGQDGNTTATIPRAERGLGIKAKLVKYKTDLEHQRALAQYPGIALDNKIKEDDLAIRQDVGALRNQLLTLTPGTPEYTEIERRLATLSGKFGEQKEPNVQMIEEQLDPTDPSSPMVKRPVRINRDGSYTRMNENVAPTNVTAESIIQSDPLSAERYAKLSPEDRTRMIQEMNKRMAERQAQ